MSTQTSGGYAIRHSHLGLCIRVRPSAGYWQRTTVRRRCARRNSSLKDTLRPVSSVDYSTPLHGARSWVGDRVFSGPEAGGPGGIRLEVTASGLFSGRPFRRIRALVVLGMGCSLVSARGSRDA